MKYFKISFIDYFQVFPKKKPSVKSSKPKTSAVDKRKMVLESKTVKSSSSKKFKGDFSPSLKQARITNFFQSPAKAEEKTLWDFGPEAEDVGVIVIQDSPEDGIQARVEASQVVEPSGKSFQKQSYSPTTKSNKSKTKKTPCKRLFSNPEDSEVPHSSKVSNESFKTFKAFAW
jgi:hypothetical protein